MSILPLLLAATLASAAPAPERSEAAARAHLIKALEAHMDGRDDEARKHLAACREAAVAGSEDEAGCRIYSEWWAKGVKQVDAPSRPEARALFSKGVQAYKAGDLAAADRLWHDCLGASETGTAVRNDCLAMIDLIPKLPSSKEERAARSRYLAAVLHYSKGDAKKVRDECAACLELAPEGSATRSDCRALLEKLGPAPR